jgi:hypothetical protein
MRKARTGSATGAQPPLAGETLGQLPAICSIFQWYTGRMKDGCGCRGKPQEEKITLDLGDAVERGKRERQAVLKRVRQQRALVFKRLAEK